MDLHQTPEPSALLADHLSRFPKGSALDVAAGYGRNALFLAEQGYRVEGVDRDEEAVAFCNAEAKRRGLTLKAFRADLENGFVFQRARYDLVTCFYYLDREIIAAMKEALRPGGVVVYETFLIDQHRKFGRPGRSEFCWRHNELLSLFLDFRVLFYFEGEKKDRWIAQLIAERE